MKWYSTKIIQRKEVHRAAALVPKTKVPLVYVVCSILSFCIYMIQKLKNFKKVTTKYCDASPVNVV